MGAVVVIVLASYSVVDAKQARVPGGGAPVAQPTLPVDERPVFVVVGDSFVGGSDMNKGPTWPERIMRQQNWIYYNEAQGGTGYINKGAAQSFTERLPHILNNYADPELIILAGGLNDVQRFPAERITSVAIDMLDQMHKAYPNSELVLFSPFAPGDPDERILALADEFEAAATAHNATYIDVSRMLPESVIGSDGTHPTDAGHKILASKVTAALKAAGIAPPLGVSPGS